MAGSRKLRGLAPVALICGLTAGFAGAQTTAGTPEAGHGHNHRPASATASSQNQRPPLVIPDVKVLTQDGKEVKFFTDLVKGKRVMINFLFTSCRASCPVSARNFQKLQEQIGSGLGKDIFLITVSTDPVVDTPEVFRKWGEKFNRREGWTLVTGEEPLLNKLLLALTGGTRQVEMEHTTTLVLYDGTSGNWDMGTSAADPKALIYDLNKLRKPSTN